MSQPDRLRYFLHHNFKSSVVTINFQDWDKMVRVDGATTRLERIPAKLSGVLKSAEIVVAVASGIANPSPGIDIVRKDPRDAPFVFNTDHYIVVEKLTQHRIICHSSVERECRIRRISAAHLNPGYGLSAPSVTPRFTGVRRSQNTSTMQRKRPNQAVPVNPCPFGTAFMPPASTGDTPEAGRDS